MWDADTDATFFLSFITVSVTLYLAGIETDLSTTLSQRAVSIWRQVRALVTLTRPKIVFFLRREQCDQIGQFLEFLGYKF